MSIRRNRRPAILGAALISAVAIGAAGYTVAGASDGEGPDRPITGTELDRASAAALTYLGQGRVSETEVGDEESLYEVEVTLDDGSKVDVQLDRDFQVVGGERDGLRDEGPGGS